MSKKVRRVPCTLCNREVGIDFAAIVINQLRKPIWVCTDCKRSHAVDTLSRKNVR